MKPYSAMEESYVWRCGEELDRFLNVTLLGGMVGETISTHSAREASSRRWACVMCRWLSFSVEKDHCAKTLAGQSISPRGGLKAGVQLLALFLAVTGLFWWAVLK
jgi:hypothetical protein